METETNTVVDCVVVYGIYVSGSGHSVDKYQFLLPKYKVSKVTKGTYCLTFARTSGGVSADPAVIKVQGLDTGKKRVQQILDKESLGLLPPIVDILDEDMVFLKKLAVIQTEWKNYVHLARDMPLTVKQRRKNLRDDVLIMVTLGLSYRRIAEILDLSKSTVQRYAKDSKPHKIIEPYLRRITQLVRLNPNLTSKEVYQHLKDEGYQGSYRWAADHVGYVKKIIEDIYG